MMKHIIFTGLLIMSLSACSVLKGGDGKGDSPNKFVLFETTEGNIKLEIFSDVSKHAQNFLKLVEEGFYDSTLFHRVIPEFMIQGGDPQSKNAPAGQPLGNGDVGYKVDAEFMDKYHHRQGALAAARDNNPQMASSGCQFYIVQGKKFTKEVLAQMAQQKGRPFTEEAIEDYTTIGGTPHLDGLYTVFGQLTEGQEVVEKISKVARNAMDRPDTDVRILRARIVKK